MDPGSSTDIDPVQKLLLEPVPMLQDMAALKIIVTLYPNRPEESAEDESIEIGDYIENSLHQLDRKIFSVGLLPTPIRELLRTRVDLIYDEIRHWTFNLMTGQMGILYEQEEYVREYNILKAFPQNCIWKQNGTIDEKQTVRNVCKRTNLTADEKFTIMCKFCLKDEIDGISLASLSPTLLKLVNIVDLLLYYWICYKKNELHKIQIENFRSLDEFMLHQNVVWDTWASAEYFLDRLNPEDQVSVAQELMIAERGIIEIHLKNVWAKMNHSQRSTILSIIPDKVLVIFWDQMYEFELAYAIWMQIREFITDEQFAELIQVLLKKTYSSEDDDVALLSIDIWDSAANHFKDYTLNNKMREILPRMCRLNGKLLLVMLKYASADYRKDFIEICEDLLIGEEYEDHSAIEDIISFCKS